MTYDILDSFIIILIAANIAVFLYCFQKSQYKKRGESLPLEVNGFSMKYHYLFWYFVIPSWAIFQVYDYYISEEFLSIFPLNILLGTEFVSAILLIVTFVGFFKYTRYSWVFLQISIVSYLSILLIAQFLYSVYTIPNLVGAFALRILTLIYYYKRKSLFTFSGTVTSYDRFIESNDENQRYTEISNESDQMNDTHDNKTAVRYCRKCGTAIYDDARFCKKCGTKLV